MNESFQAINWCPVNVLQLHPASDINTDVKSLLPVFKAEQYSLPVKFLSADYSVCVWLSVVCVYVWLICVCVSLHLSYLNKTAVFNAASVTLTLENIPSVLSVRLNKEDWQQHTQSHTHTPWNVCVKDMYHLVIQKTVSDCDIPVISSRFLELDPPHPHQWGKGQSTETANAI